MDVTQTIGGKLTLWENSYQQVSNQNGVSGYFDKDHCEMECQIYTFSKNDKVYVLKKSSSTIKDIDSIFNQIFKTFQFV